MKLWKKTCQNSPIEEIPHEKYTHEDETETQNFELDDGGLGGGVRYFFYRDLLESQKPSYMIIWVMYKNNHKVYKVVQAYRSQERPLGFCLTCLIHS